MNKSLLSAISLLFLALTLTACGGGSDAPPGDTTVSATETTVSPPGTTLMTTTATTSRPPESTFSMTVPLPENPPHSVDALKNMLDESRELFDKIIEIGRNHYGFTFESLQASHSHYWIHIDPDGGGYKSEHVSFSKGEGSEYEPLIDIMTKYQNGDISIE